MRTEAIVARATPAQRGQFDPSVDAASERGWQRWLARLAASERERLAGFGVIVLLGFLVGAAAVYAFAWLANEVLEQETTRMDAAAAGFARQFSSPTMDSVAWLISLFGSEVVLAIGLVLLGLFLWQRRWGSAVLLVLVTGGAQILNDLLKAV